MEKLLPDYEAMPTWECYAKQLDVEYRQSLEEGKNVARLEPLFREVIALPNDEAKDRLADTLFAMISEAPTRPDFPYVEPDDLPTIRRESLPFEAALTMPDEATFSDKLLGGWYGRICGCLLGKPVEGIMSDELQTILRRTGNFPMTRYIDKEEITPAVMEGLSYRIDHCAYPRDFGKMPPDDDTNYMIIGYKLLRQYGWNFKPADMESVWLGSQIKNAYCTAERVAYRNFVNGYKPPYSARYKNPYREWIGAQIRGDFFGYINPCDPETAADMGWRDASISHVKNGIYGEMWVSAMLAAAYGCDDLETIIRVGLSQLPARSRIVEAVNKVIDGYHTGVSEEAFFADLHARWDEHNGHDWTHTVSNAEIVTACLLYGGGDYGRSVGMAVQTGFDTDCNGATVGSILGVRNGFAALPASFTDRICDTLESNLFGFGRVSVRDMAEKTAVIARGYRLKGNELTFTGLLPELTDEILGYTVEMGDGSVFADCAPCSYAYAAPGCYELKVTVRRTVGSRTVTRKVEIAEVDPATPLPGFFPICSVTAPQGGGCKDISVITRPLPESPKDADQYDTFTYGGKAGDPAYIGFVFRGQREVSGVLFTEGNHFGNGGWFADGSLAVELLVNGVWEKAPFLCEPPYPVGNDEATFAPGYEHFTLTLASPVLCGGVRLSGIGGGCSGFISCGELTVV